jgi:hypothetical protein
MIGTLFFPGRVVSAVEQRFRHQIGRQTIEHYRLTLLPPVYLSALMGGAARE